MSGPQLTLVVDDGLGNSAYLAGLGDGLALAVDPPRDLRTLHAAARRAGLKVAYAADTHLHADFLPGARQLAATDRARILASAAGERTFDHVGLGDGDEAGAHYRSLQRVLTLPGGTVVWPTHGAGSFCSATPTDQRTSTIGEQKAPNTLLAAPGRGRLRHPTRRRTQFAGRRRGTGRPPATSSTSGSSAAASSTNTNGQDKSSGQTRWPSSDTPPGMRQAGGTR